MLKSLNLHLRKTLQSIPAELDHQSNKPFNIARLVLKTNNHLWALNWTTLRIECANAFKNSPKFLDPEYLSGETQIACLFTAGEIKSGFTEK